MLESLKTLLFGKGEGIEDTPVYDYSFDGIIAEAETTLRSLTGKHVEYRRSETVVTANWLVVVGNTTFEISTEFGMESYESRDYIGAIDDLLIDDGTEEVVLTPQQGDRIYETIGNSTYIYEVQSPSGQPCFKFSDPDRTIVRIHTKMVGEL